MPHPNVRYDVFLCHNRLEKDVVKDIADSLQIDGGILFFLDEYAIPASVEFLGFITTQMHGSASCAIFLGSAGWGPTQLVEAKLALEIRAKKPEFRIIPVKLPGCREEEWEELFGDGQAPPFNWVEFGRAADDQASAKLLRAIQGDLTGDASGPEAVTPYYLRRQAALWDKSGRQDGSLLIGGKLLREAQALAGKNPAFVTVNAVPAFLARCSEAERNRFRIWLSLAAAAVFVTSALGIYAWIQRNQAETETKVALARSLAAFAPQVIGERRNDERSALLARQAYLVDQAVGGASSDLITASLSQVLNLPYFSSVYHLPDGDWPDEISPTGRYLLAVKDGGSVIIGPITDANGKRASDSSIDLHSNVTFALFTHANDDLLVGTKSGDLEFRKPNDPNGEGQRITNIGAAPDILATSTDDGSIAAVVGDSRVILVDVALAKIASDWTLPVSIDSISLGLGGHLLAVKDSNSGQLHVYDLMKRKELATYPRDDDVNAFDFLPDGESVVVGERGGQTWQWTLSSNERHLLGRSLEGSVDTIAISKDGSLIAAASATITPGIRIWRTDSDPSVESEIPGARTVNALRFTQDGHFLISIDSGDEVRYWRLNGTGVSRSALATANQVLKYPPRLYSIARQPNSDTFIIGGDHGALQVWNDKSLTAKPAILAQMRSLAMSNLSSFFNQGSHIMDIKFAKGSTKFATVDVYGYVLLWDITHLNQKPALIQSPSPKHATFSVALSPSAKRVAIGTASSLTEIVAIDQNGTAGTTTRLPGTGDEAVRALRFLDDDHIIVGDDAGRLSEWALGDAPKARIIVDKGDPIMSVSVFSDGTKLLVARGTKVELIDLKSQRGAEVLTSGVGFPYSVAVSDDDKLLAAGFLDGSIRIWSAKDLGAGSVTLPVHKDVVRSIAFSRDSGTLLSVSDDHSIASTTVDTKRLARLVCDVVWRDLDRAEEREYFGSFERVTPTCAAQGQHERALP